MDNFVSFIVALTAFFALGFFFGWGFGHDTRKKEQEEDAEQKARELISQYRVGVKRGKREMLGQLVRAGVLTQEQAKSFFTGTGKPGAT